MEEISKYIYMYRKKRKSYFICKDIIMYVKCCGRQLQITMPFTSVEHTGTLRCAMQMLGEDEFVQVNKSEIINLKYLYYTDLKSVIMRDRRKIPVTAAYSAELSSRLIDMYSVKEA